MSVIDHPLIIIGLDGATFDILDPLFAQGRLPTLMRLAQGGLRTELRSTLPPATLPAWTSFLTGTNPGRHGVTDIFVRSPGTYALRPASGQLRQVPTFVARFSAVGRRVACLGVPGTYPPEPINGICIAGFDSPGASHAQGRAVWPPPFRPELQRLGGWRYGTFNEMRRGSERLRTAVHALEADIAAKERVALSVYNREPWDVFVLHLQASDTAAHHLWHTFDPDSPRASHPELRDALPRIYERLDQLIGRLLERAPDRARVLVVSDHGMGGASTRVVHLNRWLASQGLLRFRSGARRRIEAGTGDALRSLLGRLPQSALGAAIRALPAAWSQRALDAARSTGVDFASSRAFSDELDYAPSIWLNRRHVFPSGTVSEAEASSLVERIGRALLALRDPEDGTRLVAAVHRREAVLHGPCVRRAPDLIVEPAWPRGYRASFLPSRGPGPTLTRLPRHRWDAAKGAGLPGVHRREGLFLAHGPGLPAADLPVIDIASAGALVFPLAGLPIPSGVDAEIPPFLAELLAPTRSEDASIDMPTPGEYRPAESLAVSRRLRDLGYID